ncbi:MAG: TIGR03013 family XrtA/PEP-CTERM system glycosyltransferase [Deltaproteobacteria bacterium]
MNQLVVACIAGDLLCALAGLYVSFLIILGKMPFSGNLGEDGMRLAIFSLVLLFSSFLLEIYNWDKEFDNYEILARIVLSLLLSFLILSAFYYLIPFTMQGRGVLILSLAAFGLLQFCWHAFLQIWAKAPAFTRRVLVLGTGPLARQIGDLITSSKSNYLFCGYLNCANEPVTVPHGTIVGFEGELLETAKKENIYKIVVSLSERRGVFPLESIMNCKMNGIKVMDAPTFYEKISGKLLLEYITPSWFIFSQGFKITSFYRFIKRVMDIAIALILAVATLPLLPIIALLIKLDSPGPILFKQARVGERDVIFFIYKFRTMLRDAENRTGAVWAKQNDPRITRVGRFLRKSRLDEIPQLYNVLGGEMSIVGPRPERPEFMAELKEVVPFYSERHFFKPGITGWAQVCYPYGASINDALEKLRYDMYYIKNWSFALDLMILLETLKVVLFGRGGR